MMPRVYRWVSRDRYPSLLLFVIKEERISDPFYVPLFLFFLLCHVPPAELWFRRISSIALYIGDQCTKRILI